MEIKESPNQQKGEIKKTREGLLCSGAVKDQRRPKAKRGDRRDAVWLNELDAMHGFVPYLYPNRADNEAFIREQIDLTNLMAYLEKKNVGHEDFKYTFFHAIVAAAVKTVTLRPQLNRFIQGNRVYQRHALTTAFVVKKTFNDESHEALAYLYFDKDCTIDIVHDEIEREVTTFRKGNVVDNSTQGMDMLLKLPRPILRLVMKWLFHRDYRGTVPYDLIKTDPNYATLFFSNLGSIKLNAAYHHLNNWGTNSVFIVIGEKKKTPVFKDDGSYEMHDMLEIGLTLDERISDGYYYSKSVKLLKYLLQNPELLERPAEEEVDYA